MASAVLSSTNLLFGVDGGTDVQVTASSAKLTLTTNTKIEGLANPTVDTGVATKAYVDGVAEGLDIKDSCTVGTTANIADLSSVTSVDGVTLANNDRVLVKDQSTGSQNGIYVFTLSTTTLARADDMAVGSNAAGTFTFVEKGNTNADKGFVCTTDKGSDTVGANSLTFTQFSGAGQITAGDGLTKSGDTISISDDGVTNTMMADNAIDTDQIAANAVTTAKIADSNVTTGKLDLTGQTNLTFGSTGGNQVLNIASHDLVDGGLQLGGTLVTASAAELNYLDITTLGISEDSKAITQSSGGVITIGTTNGNQVLNVASHDLVDGGLQLGGTLVTASAAELNYLDITTLGISEDSKAITQSSGGVITIGTTNGNQVLNVASHDLVDGGLQLAGTLVTASAAELNILDGDTSATSTTLADADRLVVNDAGTMKQVALTDLETYMETSLDTLSNVTSVGALNSGSITSGFGSIDVGSSTISTTGIITGGGLTVGNAVLTETELEILDGATVTTTELNIMDGDANAQASSVTIVDGDQIILNDDGVMKQVPVTDLKTYTSADANLTKTATADGDDLTVSLTAGQYDASLVMSSSGAANDALQLTASAGGMDITAAKALDITTSANNANITIDPHGSGTLALGSADNTAVTLDALALTLTSVNALTLTDGTASLVLGGTGATSLSGATTVDLDCTGALSLNSSADVINIGNDAVAQAINIGTGAAARTITVGNTTGATALDVNLGTGGLTVDCEDGGAISLDAHGAPSNLTLLSTAAADDLTIALTGATDSSLILSSTGTGADAVQLTASAGGIDITADGSLDLSTSGNNSNITLTPNGSGEVTATTTVNANFFAVSDREQTPSYQKFVAQVAANAQTGKPKEIVLGEIDVNASDDMMVILRSQGSEMGVDMIGEAHHFINQNTGISDAITVGIETDVSTISNGDDIAKLQFAATGSNIDLTNTRVGEIVAKALTNFSNDGAGNDTNRTALIFNVANNGSAQERLRITSDGISLANDSAAIFFGANEEIRMTHVHDSGLTLKHTATGDDKPIVLTLATGETDIAADDVIGALNFQAPDESTGTDANLVCAGIEAVSEGDFSASSNATKLSFKTGSSEAAAEKVTIDSAGNLSLTASNTELRFYEGANYVGFEAPALSADQIWVLPTADGTANQVLQTNGSGTLSWGTAPGSNANIIIPDDGNIGSSSDTDAISISAAGVVSMSATTESTSATTGALTVAGGVGIAKDLSVGDDVRLISDAAVLSFGANEDVTLTHVAGQTPGLLLNTSSQLQFRDSAIHISSDADGYMNVQADTGINLNIDGTDKVTLTSTTATFGVTISAPVNSTIADFTFANGSITSDTGTIDFDNENLTTTGTITSSSDVRLKKDIVEIDNCVDKIKKLRGVNFKWIQDGREDFGVIAQEVEEVAPHAVIENKEGMKSVDYGRLTTLLIQAVKEQQTQIDELKDLVAKLTNKE